MSAVQELEFVDLSDLNEEEKSRLCTVLHTPDPKIELPWGKLASIAMPAMEHCGSQHLNPTARSFGTDYHEDVHERGLDQSQEHALQNTPVYQEIPPISVMTVPPPNPNTVPPSVMTTMYQMMGPPTMPLSNVFVSNVTASVNVHSFVGPPIGPFSQVYHHHHASPEVSLPHHDNTSSAGRTGGPQRRQRLAKTQRKQGEMPFHSSRNASLDVIVQNPPVVETPPTGSSPIQPQNYIIPYTIPHPYSPTYYSSPQTPHAAAHMQHPSAQHATGTPIYLQGPVPLYPPPVYGSYHPSPQQPNEQIVFTPASSLSTLETANSDPPNTYNHLQENGDGVPELVENLAEVQISSLAPVNLHSDNSESQISDNNYVKKGEETSELSLDSGINYHVKDSEQFNYVDHTDHENVPEVLNEEISGNQTGDKTSQSDSQDSQITLGKNVNSNMASTLEKESVKDNSISNKNSINQNNSTRESLVTSEASKPLADNENNVISSKKSVPGNVAPFTKPVDSLKGVNATNLSDSFPEINVKLSKVSDSPTQHTPVSQQSSGKSWASLFSSSASTERTMVVPGSLNKPLAAVKPFQNAVPVAPGSKKDVNCEKLAGNSALPSNNNESNMPSSMSCSANDSVLLDDPVALRLAEYLSKYQLEHKAVSLQPRGLTNRSNWCYVNSTLQALLACPPFYNLMKSLPLQVNHNGIKSHTPIIDSIYQFVNEFSPMSPATRVNRKEKALRKDENIEVQCGPAFEPSYIYKMLNNIQSDTFKVEGRQEDAEEFLSCLLNALNDEMLELVKLVEDGTQRNSFSNGDVVTNGDVFENPDEDDTEWKVMGPKNKGSITRRADFGRTPISDIFRGQLRSRVQRAGDESTDNVQPFFTLQLDIEKAQSVKEALELLVGKDQLEGITCSRTNQEIEAWQQVTIEQLPLVLVLHLKWFDYKLDGCSKIVKTVEFPIDLKVDGKLMSSNKKGNPKQKQYKLFAVVYHDGKEASKGHYITDAYHVGYGGWVRYDDSTVKSVQENQMLHPRVPRVPYLLYYRRCDTIVSPAVCTPDKSR